MINILAAKIFVTALFFLWGFLAAVKIHSDEPTDFVKWIEVIGALTSLAVLVASFLVAVWTY